MIKKFISKTEFVEQALNFKTEMAKPRTLDELHNLWRQTSFPYVMDTPDPLSDSYSSEVLDLYSKLTSTAYSVSNELTSPLQQQDDFAIGYPWISKNLRVVSVEMGKAVQALKIVSQHQPDARNFVEFGSGWGNLVIPLARSGMSVTAIDIDPGFIRRLNKEAKLLDLQIKTVTADFNAATDLVEKNSFDCVIFSSSFHHCIDFVNLLKNIKSKVLKPKGCIYFFAEPIYQSLSFPWGLRYDGESIWAITCNKWLELGFEESFFISVVSEIGYQIHEIPDASGFGGRCFVASLE